MCRYSLRQRRNLCDSWCHISSGGGVSIVVQKISLFRLIIDPDNFLWFLYDLFIISLIVNIIISLLRNITRNKKTILLCMFVFSIIILVIGKFIPENVCNIKSICWMFQFYVAGAAYKEYKELKNEGVIGIIMFLIFLIVVWARYVFLSQDSLFTYVIMMVVAYIGVLASFILFKSFFNKKTILIPLGQSTLGLYAVHQRVITILNINSVIIVFLLTFIISFIVVYIIRKTKYLKFVIGE